MRIAPRESGPDDPPSDEQILDAARQTRTGRAMLWLLERLGDPAAIEPAVVTRDPMLDAGECVVCGAPKPTKTLRVERPEEHRWWSAFVPGSFGKRLLLPACGRCVARERWRRVIGAAWFFIAFGAGVVLHAGLRSAGLHPLLSLGLATVVAFALMPWGWVLFPGAVSMERGARGDRVVCRSVAVRDRVARAIGLEIEPERAAGEAAGDAADEMNGSTGLSPRRDERHRDA